MIVGSAPTYPHGAYDDIAALSDLALKFGSPYLPNKAESLSVSVVIFLTV